MKWPYYIKYKIKAAAFLAFILGAILVGNILEKNSFSSLDNSIASIYKDRLQVSKYIYEISNILYQKRLLTDKGIQDSNAGLKAIEHYNSVIAGLITSYEKTVLTEEEAQQWTLFKKNLNEYNALERSMIDFAVSDFTGKELEDKFEETISNLNALSNIQVGEGYHIRESSHSIVSNRIMFSYFEISLVIVLGLFTLVLLAATDRNIFKQQQNAVLN